MSILELPHLDKNGGSTTTLILALSDETRENVRSSVSARWPESRILFAPRASEVLRLVQSVSTDVVILDLAIAEGNGLDVLRSIRALSDVPVIILGVDGDEAIRVNGLEMGADDFVVTPFSYPELLARVQAVVRRARTTSYGQEEILRVKNLTINTGSGRAFVNGRETALSATEWKLLIYLARNAGRIVPPLLLASNVWGVTFVEPSTIKMCVRRLRMKLADDTRAPRIIRCHRGRGYSFEPSA
jgi:DNA-binding response OmpR family regulator